MAGELDTELDQMIAKYGVKAVIAAAQRARMKAPPRKAMKAPPRKALKEPRAEYDPKTGMKLPTGRPRSYGPKRLPPKGIPVVAQPSPGTIQTYMSKAEGKLSPDQIAEMISEDINFNNGLIMED